MALPRRRRTHAPRLPAFTARLTLRDGTEIVATAFLRSIADNDVALYEIDVYGIEPGDVGSVWAVELPERSLFHVNYLPAIIDLR